METTSQPTLPTPTSTCVAFVPNPEPLIVNVVPPNTDPCSGKTFVRLRSTVTVGIFPDLK